MKKEAILEVKNLKKYFNVKNKGTLKAVDDITFTINKGETLGLVGESGCGKTTCGRTILGIYPKTGGEIIINGINNDDLKGKEKLKFKKDCQMIFQDPYASLDPRMTIGEIIGEGMDVHFNISTEEKNKRIKTLLERVGLTPDYQNRFPHELSGGQRQRIGIARALAVEPKFIVCDEPISALDVSIQAQIVNLLIRLQKEDQLTYLFISHDLSMVKHISDRVGVMYLGSMVELASNIELYDNPMHPYTKALIAAIPEADPDNLGQKKGYKLEGEVPSPINPPSGCKFHGRCPIATELCKTDIPELRELKEGHFVACHHA
ncbi:ABC transporter ATP-binding protein [Anaeropeptidivorans aminofermentans]|uniref:ABC transporter ATP-binding protein n=1 Tax=Anaeropeptidivorans aminofermentans TaxID=2934315 RepID=UPI0020255F59|nr:oligopeptide/dipeptide ABC transporter ATP-binding protein [Anaeropeptidivorans aminofermentans]